MDVLEVTDAQRDRLRVFAACVGVDFCGDASGVHGLGAVKAKRIAETPATPRSETVAAAIDAIERAIEARMESAGATVKC